MENYILSKKLPKWHSFSKLKTSSHALQIETGRYKSPKIPADQRFCTLCNTGEVEDEQHFMLSCKFMTMRGRCYLTNAEKSLPSTLTIPKILL
jgi:hypothetical protein